MLGGLRTTASPEFWLQRGLHQEAPPLALHCWTPDLAAWVLRTSGGRLRNHPAHQSMCEEQQDLIYNKQGHADSGKEEE